jgi:hypothetical protein
MQTDQFEALYRTLAGSTSRRRALGLLGLGTGLAIVGPGRTPLGWSEAAAKKRGGAQDISFNNLIGIPIHASDNDQHFRGTLTVLQFEQQGQGIVAVSRLRGVVSKPNGKGNQRISRQVRVPVGLPGVAGLSAQATCNILDLTLGPIDLTLLGLHLHVNQIHITLTAQSGPGNLLGNLLCSIADLLNGGNVLGQLGQLVNLLNQLLGVLQGL